MRDEDYVDLEQMENDMAEAIRKLTAKRTKKYVLIPDEQFESIEKLREDRDKWKAIAEEQRVLVIKLRPDPTGRNRVKLPLSDDTLKRLAREEMKTEETCWRRIGTKERGVIESSIQAVDFFPCLEDGDEEVHEEIKKILRSLIS